MVEVLNSIANFFKNIGGFLGVDLITIITLCLTVVIVFIGALVANFSVEVSTNRKVKQINKYLEVNPFITDENIVEFNRIMKHRMPRAMRYQWQTYMVNRDEKPSKFLTEDNCITKAFRTSAFMQTIKQVKYAIGILSVLSFTLILGALFSNSGAVISDASSVIEVLLKASLTPAIIILLAFIFTSLMNVKRNAVLNELFYNFDEMQHRLDNAVSTFPAFVDYEILFTKKEIAAGIPALQEYLKKRADYEQEQLEKARLSQVEHENYDFSKLGIKGTIIMDRAMKECEFYLGNRKILLADIDNLQSEKDLLTKNFEEKNRENQRKLRDIKESLDRLREKLNNTTNKIVGNEIIRQQADEVKKQQLVEKEMDEDNNQFTQEAKKLDDQIERKRAEIEKNKTLVENTLINDFKDYSDKIYDELKQIADSKVFEELSDLRDAKDNLEHELEDRERYIIQKNAMYDEKVKENESVQLLRTEIDELKRDLIIKNQEIIGANKEIESRMLELKTLQREIERLRKEKYHEVYRYFDTDGMEFFYDENGEPYYYDSEGRITYYTDAEKIKELKAQKKKAEANKQLEQENINRELVEANKVQKETKEEEIPAVEEDNKEPVQTEPEQAEETQVEEVKKETPEQEVKPVNALTDEDKILEEQFTEPEETQPEQEQIVEEPQQESPVELESLSNKEVEELNELLNETPTEVQEPNEAIQAPVNDSVSKDDIKQLEDAINEQNKKLEEQYSLLQEQLEKAEKVVEEPIAKEPKAKKPTKSKKAPAKKKKPSTKKSSTKKSAEKKPADKKPTTKKATTKPAQKKTTDKPKAKKPVVRQQKKQNKKDFVFKVKPSPKAEVDDNGIDLSGFNDLIVDQDKDKDKDK